MIFIAGFSPVLLFNGDMLFKIYVTLIYTVMYIKRETWYTRKYF